MYVSCLSTCVTFRQTRFGQDGTVYRQQEAMPEDVWASPSGVCEDSIPLQIYCNILYILGFILVTSILGVCLLSPMQ